MNTDELSIEIKGQAGDANQEIKTLIDNFKSLNNNINQTFNSLSKYGTLESQLKKLNLPDLNSDFYKLKSSIKDTTSETKTYTTANNQVVTITKKVKNGLEDVRVKLKEVANEGKNGSKGWDSFTKGIVGSLVKLKVAYAGIRTLYSKITDFTAQATEYEEALNLFTVTMGSKAADATKWVEKFSKALYIDDSGLMQYMGSLNSLIKGLGVGSDNAYLMSKNLTQLVYDLASFKNLDIETSFRKIQSAMSGEIEPLRNVGVALSQNTLQELANEKGIKQRVSTMSEAQKAQLRYIQILQSTTEWQGDMARTLVSPANALRVLSQQFILLGRALGRVFIPFVMKAIPYVMALTQVLTDLANKLADFFGYKITDIDYSSLKDISFAVEDIGDSAESSAKKLHTMLAPFDELNVVQSQNNGSGTGGLMSGGDLGLPLPEYDALAGLTEEMSKNVAEARKNLKKFLPIVKAIGAAFLGWKIFKGTMKFLSMFAEGGTIAKGMSVISKLGKSLGSVFEGLGATLGLTGLASGFAAIALSVGFTINNVGFLSNAFKDLQENNISLEESFSKLNLPQKLLLILGFGNPLTVIVSEIRLISEAIKELKEGKSIADIFGEWFPTASKFVSDFADNFKKIINNIVTGFKNTFGPVFSWVNTYVIQPIWEIVSGLFERIKIVIDKIVEIITTIGQIVGAIAGFVFDKVKEVIGNVIEAVKPVFDKIVGFIRPIVDWVYDHIVKPVTKFFKDLVEDVVGFFQDIGERVSEGFSKTFKGALNTAFTVIETPINAFIDGLNKVVDVVKKIPGTDKIKKVGKLQIPRFAEGGFPQTGEFFMAREDGPEMVGRIGNRSAVANNDQITTSITNALITALSDMNFGGRGTTVVNIGGRKVYEGIGDYVDSENDRYGTNYVRV